jgi:FAD synthase
MHIQHLMKVVSSLSAAADILASSQPCLSIGNFDGLQGHRAILKSMVRTARALALPAVAMTRAPPIRFSRRISAGDQAPEEGELIKVRHRLLYTADSIDFARFRRTRSFASTSSKATH